MKHEEFHSFCDNLVPDENGCRNWPMGLGGDGYPIVWMDNKSQRANRVRLTHKLGRPLISGMKACHTCDNPQCLELEHLFEGTAADNSQDMVSKGRSKAAKGADHYASSNRGLKTASEKDIQRFMSFVEKLTNGCWYWSGSRSRGKKNKKWYGSFHYDGKTVRAHRFACEQIKGEYIRIWEQREHLCRFSLCVNPDHLEIVDKEENQRRSRLPLPPVTLHYEYIDGEIILSLKNREDSVDFDFTDAQETGILMPVSRTGELENGTQSPHLLAPRNARS